MKKLLFILGMMGCILPGQSQEVKTTFQTSQPWKRSIDVQADAVMVYGTGKTLNERVESWRKKGYTTHFMTGIAWGGYKSYFYGMWDGKKHTDEVQMDMKNDSIMHGPMNPYIVPSLNYLKYFKETQIKPVIDAGISEIFLEEPEFWAYAGYSEAFKREWEAYYGFPWRAQHLSAENTYLSNKLKYHLYYRALDEAFAYAKEYGKQKGMDVKCYVPTHSLINYSMWHIVSPEASLASMKHCDGYIAQVWTGTSRVPNYFNGKRGERVFETAFLEYGCMESMTRPTGRKMFFLTDPIEDRKVDWEDYKRNYQATFTAQLLYPQIADYEIMPWPNRIYEGLYRKSANSEEKGTIPRFYSTQMQVMVNTLNPMPLSENKVNGSQGISILMANSLMFQRSLEPVEGYEDPQLSNFFGLTLPLLKRGVPVSITHLENVGYADTWKDVKVLLMTYSNMKPLDPKAHEHLAEWVKQGGTIIYCGRDNDVYQNVLEWWNQNGNSYTAPSQHLFTIMGIPEKASEGVYTYGKGNVYVVRQDPKEFVMNERGDATLLKQVEAAYGQLEYKNHFYLERGPYVMAAVLDENAISNEPLQLQGHYIDLFDPKLPCMEVVKVNPGEQAFLFDIDAVKDAMRPQVLAAASRQYEEKVGERSFAFTAKSPANTDNVMRILLPKEPKKVKVAATYQSEWDAKTRTLLLQFENQPEGVQVEITW